MTATKKRAVEIGQPPRPLIQIPLQFSGLYGGDNMRFLTKGAIRSVACILLLLMATTVCQPMHALQIGESNQFTIGELYKLCNSSIPGEKTACTFFIRGIFEGATEVGNTVRDQSGNRQGAKDKRFCAPPDLTISRVESVVKARVGQILARYPDKSNVPAAALVIAIVSQEFSCQQTK